MFAKLKISFFVALLFLQNITTAEANPLKRHKLGSWKVDFGIDERLRYEYKENFDFSDKRKDNGSMIYNRVKLNSRAILGDKYEVFIEGMDLRVGNVHLKKADQRDSLDLHQAYFKMNDIAGLNLDFKIGRQELAFGKGRLIWAATWSNRINHFDAGLLHYKYGDFYADLFSGLKVGYDNNNFNRPTTHELISGIYTGYQEAKDKLLVEGYFLNQTDAEDPGNLRRYTVGMRLQATAWRGWVIDFETPYQFGNDQAKDISAYALHIDARKGFDIAWKPELTLSYNLASGDDKVSDNKTNTFIPLYQSTHEPYGIMDFFRWQNMHEAAIDITLSPHKKLKVIPAMNFFWLYSNKDSWYNSSGTKLRTNTSGNAAYYVGQEVSVRVQYNLNNYVKLESGYAHFFSGPYVKDTGANDDADWFYIQSQIKF